jgi:hypothetical protein
VSGGKGARALVGMPPVGLEVHKVVDDVDRGCGEAKREEGGQGGGARAGVTQQVRGQHRHEHQQVLHPLVGPHRAQQPPASRGRRIEGAPDLATFGGARPQARARVHDDGAPCRRPNRQVRRVVACIVEAAFAEACHQRVALGACLQVVARGTAQHFIEQVEMGRRGLRERGVARGRENDAAAPCLFAAQPRQEGFVPGEGVARERDAIGDRLLERGLAAQQPEGQRKRGPGCLCEEGNEAFQQQVGGEQRAVEIDGERGLAGGVVWCRGFGSGRGQVDAAGAWCARGMRDATSCRGGGRRFRPLRWQRSREKPRGARARISSTGSRRTSPPRASAAPGPWRR